MWHNRGLIAMQQPRATAAHMRDLGLTRDMLTGMPKRLNKVPQKIIQRLRIDGVITPKQKTPKLGYLWDRGCNYEAFMKWL